MKNQELVIGEQIRMQAPDGIVKNGIVINIDNNTAIIEYEDNTIDAILI